MTTEYQCSEQRFLEDVKDHKMTIIRDNGVDRHIRFKRENGSPYWFDIVTYGGRLIIDGDMGTYVFARIEDMFDFFRTKKNDWNYNKDGLSINPSYWGEKLRAVENYGYGSGKILEFSMDIFKKKVEDYFNQHFEDEIQNDKAMVDEATEDYPLTEEELKGIAERKERRDSIWEQIEDDVLRYPDNEYDANKAAYDFDEDGFQFVDFHEYNCKEYTFGFIWCCYAIAYAVRTYDLQVIAKSTEECLP